MTKPSFASLLRRAAAAEADAVEIMEAPLAAVAAPFAVDPARVRLWPALGAAVTTPDACAAIRRDGQHAPVIVRPVFDDEYVEYEVVAGAPAFAAIRRLREEDPTIRLLVRVEMVDDDGAATLAAREVADPLYEAFGGEVPVEALPALTDRLHGPLGPALRTTASQIGRAQAARHADGLPPYPATEVLRLLDAVGEMPQAERLELTIVDAGERSVTFRLTSANALTPEVLARAIKAMVDGAAAEHFAITWAAAT